MIVANEAVLRDPVRLSAVQRARRELPVAPLSADGIARLAARLLDAPMAAVTLVDAEQEHFVGGHNLPASLAGAGHAPLAYSVCKYIVSQDHPVISGDLLGEQSRELREHVLAEQFGVRAFAGVPVRDDDDHPVGSLTVLDTAAREWTGEQVAILVEIAELLRPAATGISTRAVDTLDSAALLDSVQEAFLAVTPDGIVAGFNRAAQQTLGFTAEDVYGRHLDESLELAYDDQPIGAALQRLFAAAPRRPVVRELSVRHKDGHRLASRASLSVIPSAGGPLACVFLTDLSGETAAQELADRHGSFLSALLDSLSVGVIACDDTGRTVLLNRALREVVGWSDEEVPADYPAWVDGALRHDDLRLMTWQQTPMMRAFHTRQTVTDDVVTVFPGHRTRTFASTAQPIIAGDGRRLGAVAVAHEVTAMRRAERFRDCHRQVEYALRTATSAYDAAPDILRAVTTSLNWPCAELFLVDEATADLRSAGHYDATGAAQDGLFGQTPSRGQGVIGRVWQTGQPIWVPDLADAGHGENPDDRAHLRVCLAHGIRTVLAVPVRDGGTLLGVLACYAGAPEFHEDLLTVLLDGVAAQIGVYVALRRAEQLTRQLTRAQDDFVDLVGHELRTPLTSIAANAELLAEDAALLDREHQQMIRVIGRNAAALQQTVGTLLDLAGLDSGHVELTSERCDLAAIVSGCVATARTDTGLSIDVDVLDASPIHGDAERLRQVITDLLSNAAKYSPADGRIHVRLDTGDDDTVELCIADTGIGTPAGERARVFDRFFRGSNVRHHGIPGSGLGLSLAHAIVRRHHGSITLDPNQPNGTIARVRLPRSSPA
ncbi:GAF domain-containing protein [Actinoplanes cyaneus]|uniref:GAF domain-containing protein n=1 Tax=Actinoplanes cyaneus TaxID=52696 RepID=UPI001EF207AE|nr:GAF domain-containing protein [Actinoplanes cyaneus]MCW2141152.1 PAS domain S-box-containing protein [Actinoplanes cyaneus]